MKKLLVFALAVTACSAIASPADDAEARRIVKQIYADWTKLMKTEDLSLLPKVMRKDYMLIGANGQKTDYNGMKKWLEGFFPDLEDFKLDVKIHKIDRFGDEITIWAGGEMSFLLKDKSGKKRWVKSDGIDMDVIKKTDGVWKFALTQQTG